MIMIMILKVSAVYWKYPTMHCWILFYMIKIKLNRAERHEHWQKFRTCQFLWLWIVMFSRRTTFQLFYYLAWNLFVFYSLNKNWCIHFVAFRSWICIEWSEWAFRFCSRHSFNTISFLPHVFGILGPFQV